MYVRLWKTRPPKTAPTGKFLFSSTSLTFVLLVLFKQTTTSNTIILHQLIRMYVQSKRVAMPCHEYLSNKRNNQSENRNNEPGSYSAITGSYVVQTSFCKRICYSWNVPSSILFILLCVYSMKNLLGPLVAVLQVLQHVHGHGRLMDPPARNSMWRFGFPNPVNYNDNELYCGGYTGMIYLKSFQRILILVLRAGYSTMGTKRG